MDVMHADGALAEIGYVADIDRFDAEASIETDADIQQNTFALTIPDLEWSRSPILEGHHIYVPGTEFGGKVEMVRHSTANQSITMSGLNWRGALYRKTVMPPAGQTHLAVAGEANAAISALMGGMMGTAYQVASAGSGITVNQRYRFTRLLYALHHMLAQHGGALRIDYDQASKKAVLSAVKTVDYSSTIDLSQDYGVDMITTTGGYNLYNHVVALGAGELLDRDILHVYRNADGSTTTTPPAWAGTASDLMTVYDYNNPEDVTELRKGADKLLSEMMPLNQIEIDPRVQGLDLQLGDIVGARDRLTGMVGKATVVGKILTMDSDGIKLETRVK